MVYLKKGKKKERTRPLVDIIIERLRKKELEKAMMEKGWTKKSSVVT